MSWKRAKRLLWTASTTEPYSKTFSFPNWMNWDCIYNRMQQGHILYDPQLKLWRKHRSGCLVGPEVIFENMGFFQQATDFRSLQREFSSGIREFITGMAKLMKNVKKRSLYYRYYFLDLMKKIPIPLKKKLQTTNIGWRLLAHRVLIISKHITKCPNVLFA